MRRIGVLMSLAADDPESSARLTAFVHALQQLGWSDGRNVLIDIRWGICGGIDRARAGRGPGRQHAEYGGVTTCDP
jgi:putative ABC transport system substrate-binding protein